MQEIKKITKSISIIPLFVLLIILVPMIIQNGFSSTFMVSVFQQTIIYLPAILAQLLFLMIGNIHFSIGGGVVLGAQFISYLYLVFHWPLWISFWLALIIYTFLTFQTSLFYDKNNNIFEVFTFAFIFITKGLSDYIFTKINMYHYVSTGVLSQNDIILHSPFVIIVIIGGLLFFYLNYTYQGKATAYIPLVSESTPYKNHSFRILIIISSMLILISSYLLIKRTGMPNTHDSLDLNYLLLTAGIMVHNKVTSKNIIVQGILCALCVVAINSLVFFLAITPMVRYCIYGMLVLVSYINFQRKPKNHGS